MKNTTMQFDSPAQEWDEAFPLGNGSLGAMVHGGTEFEHIQLNQESVWSGGPLNRINKASASCLPKVRQLLLEERYVEADQLIYEDMLSDPMQLGHYEPLADLNLVLERRIPHHNEQFEPHKINYSDYHRTLDMERSLYSCFYTQGTRQVQREAFISYPDQIMAMQITSNEPLYLRIELSRDDAFDTLYTTSDTITLKGQCSRYAPEFVCMAKAVTDGTIIQKQHYLIIENAYSITVYVAGRTSYYRDFLKNISTDKYPEDFYLDPTSWCETKLNNAFHKGYAELKEAHLADVTTLFDRVEIDLGEEDGKPFSAEKFYNFGRYLLIASSRPGSLPTTLQGIWNKDYHPNWGSRYTININTEMNYWLCDSANLPECHTPLLSFIRSMLPNGREVARKLYNCRGAAAHHNTDIYGDCAPNEHWMPASLWPNGLGWLATHIIEHFRFTADITFLHEYLPVLAEICLFYLDFTFEDNNGNLITGPSTSPENTFLTSDGVRATVCLSPAMDIQLIRELWEGFLDLCQASTFSFETIDGISVYTIAEMIREKLPKLPSNRIGSRGQLLEWQKEYDEWEPGHRHISHLYGLFPGNTITEGRDPEALKAAKITLNERLSHGGGYTGWSRGWLINFYARLGDAESAFQNLDTLLHEQTAPNLFDLHPPLNSKSTTVFQIDGNFGAAAGISEMLMQTKWDSSQHCWVPVFLPALPKAWSKAGHVRGLRVRGNKLVNMAWKDGTITQFDIVSISSQKEQA